MNEPKKPGRWRRIGSALTRLRIILSNLIFFTFLVLFLVVLFSGVPLPQVPDKGALVLNPRGAVVEQRSPVDPIQQWLSPQTVLAETELSDLLDALDHVREDPRLPMVVLNLDDLQFLSAAHADAVGEALLAVREAGKEVVAYGSYFDQQPYLMASFADAVYMHPLGQVVLPGYRIKQLYFKGLIDKLKVNVHVFRAGRYKEFVEPYTRTDMSEEAREANRELIGTLWQRYAERVRDNRRIEPDRFERYTQQIDQALTETDGDLARLALEYHLVDELLTPDQARVRIADTVGYDEDGEFSGIGFRDYLQAVNGAMQPDASAEAKVGVITAQGPVVMGDQLRGVIAAERLVKLIRQAREDRHVAALVLRINTPGGSSFASELIRQELELTQLAGKPVVVSMGPVAASGGYWIASTADAIFAEPTTLTGSIGVFGIVPTFEDSLAAMGVSSDGVASSPVTGVDPLLGLSDPTARMLQAGTENIYQRFINLVARGRDMPAERVNEIAEGRVWVGSRALDLGLVDDLGGQDEAVARAAELAGLERFGIQRIEIPLSPRELLLQRLFSNLSLGSWLGPQGAVVPLVRQAEDAWKRVQSLNDPRHSYALCLTCELTP